MQIATGDCEIAREQNFFIQFSNMGESGMSHAKSGSWANRMKSIHGLRKRNKPLVEKKRRARINESLSQLKSLVLESMQRTGGPCSKLEKADILEMTVKQMRHLKQQLTERELVSKYRVGYNECANDVMRYLGQTNNMDTDSRSRLIDRLSDRMEPGMHARIRPRSECFTPPTTEVSVRRENHYETLLQIAPNRCVTLSPENEHDQKTFLTNENVTKSRPRKCNTYPTEQDTFYHTSNGNVPGYMVENTSEQDQIQYFRNPTTERTHTVPLSDIIQGANSQTFTKRSTNRNSSCDSEYNPQGKQQLPPFRIFAETLRQGSRKNMASYTNCRPVSDLQRNKRDMNTWVTQPMADYSEPDSDTVRDPSPHDMIPNGLLGLGPSNVWRPW